jgi:hypothetical protein
MQNDASVLPACMIQYDRRMTTHPSVRRLVCITSAVSQEENIMQHTPGIMKRVNLDAVCVYNHFPCFIHVSECSEYNMIIRTKSNERMSNFQRDDVIRVIIPIDNEDLSMNARISTVGKTDSSHCIMDIHFRSPDIRYLKYLSKLD